MRTVAMGVATVSSLVLVSGCGVFREVEVTNGCAESIAIKDVAAPFELIPTELAPGESATVAGSDGPIEVGVGAPGSSADEIFIDWEDMQATGEKSARLVTIDGDTCPKKST